MSALRELVPRALRHAVSAQLARARADRLDRDLAALAATSNTIVAGPWLGEVGFELLYWVPFLAWFAERFNVGPERLMVVSRGGTASWYAPFASGYRDIFDQLTPDEFRRRHDERVQANGEQKQTQVLAFERDLLRRLVPDVRDRAMLHPSTMYSLYSPFWWGHVDEQWVHQRARYHRLEAACSGVELPAEAYVAVKFYFTECFPPTDENRTFVRELVRELTQTSRVVSLTTGLNLDDHGHEDDPAHGRAADVTPLPAELHPRDNLAVQSRIVAGASAFVGTYGGFSYLAPFLGVRSTAYFGDAGGFSKRHLLMARSALDVLGAGHLFTVHSNSGAVRLRH
jgi:hypothetical protein